MARVYRLEAQDREAIVRRLSRELADREEIAFAYVHGSFLQLDGFRDIDVAVWMNGKANSRFDLELATTLSRAVRYPVDVRIINHAPVSFLFRVFRGRPVSVRNERLLADLIERTARRYHDAAPLVHRATREAFGR
jgi:predicted nucleotidyltransferase